MDGFGCVVLSVVRRTHIWGVSGGDVVSLVHTCEASARKRKRKDVHTETFVKQHISKRQYKRKENKPFLFSCVCICACLCLASRIFQCEHPCACACFTSMNHALPVSSGEGWVSFH